MWKYAALLSLVWLGSICRALLPICPLLHPFWKHTRLGFATRDLSGLRYWTLFISLISRSISGRFLRLRNVQVVSEGKGHLLQGGDISVTTPFELTATELNKYAQAAGVDHGEFMDNPLHLMLFLSAATEPAMLMLLSKVNCPVDPVGSVNTRNRFEILDPTTLKAVLTRHLKGVRNEGLSVVAKLEDAVQKVKRGWEVTVVVDLELEMKPVYRQSFTFLQFHKHSHSPTPTAISEEVDATPNGRSTGSQTITLKPLDPSLWATLSKDYNPIHFFNLIAKLFGFKSRIAHGNQVLAKAISGLNHKGMHKSVWLEVDFRRPVFVPSTLDVRESRDQTGSTVEIGSGGKIQVIARYN